ncbi:MAG TPA: acyl-CoA dehydrogenase family protein [Phenylobacterium sp.]|nr:acyl-CoA dehydrogenase family protein [Phenylobacterium sp.]
MELPETALIGAEGEGYRIALSSLETGRIGIAAQSVGMAQAALAMARAWAACSSGDRARQSRTLRGGGPTGVSGAIRPVRIAPSRRCSRRACHPPS